MTIEIPHEYQHFLTQIIDSGSYKTETEVVVDALRLLQERRQRMEELRSEIQPALDRLDRGEGIDMDDVELDAFFEEVKRQGRAHIISGQ